MLETGVFIFFSLSRSSQFPSFPSAALRVGKKAGPSWGGRGVSLSDRRGIYYRLVCFLLNHLQGVRPERNCFICPCFHFSICNQKIMKLYLLPTHLRDTRVQINWGWIGVWQSALGRIGLTINKDVSWMSDFNKRYHSPLWYIHILKIVEYWMNFLCLHVIIALKFYNIYLFF